MARRNGCQLPAHGFQISAITVYFLLSIAFCVFLAPFLGKDSYEYVTLGIYSFFAISVLILYARCTTINPADPGIFVHPNDEVMACKSQDGLQLPEVENQSVSFCGGLVSFLCACLVTKDCRRDDVSSQRSCNNDSLFCTLCNAEVNKFSKHCRSCDKCVQRFDHHCRWVNNCIGRKNYITFLSLVSMTLLWLIVEFGVGMAVLVRCFTHKKDTDVLINEKLGVIFPRALFASIVALCTTVSFLACIPLGELLCFHVLLNQKGITTYEYIMAIRTQSETAEPSMHEDLSVRSSPFSPPLVTMSGTPMGLINRAAWCTPPRVFFDHQDEIVPHLERGHLPSTIDPDAVDALENRKRASKRPVRISAWKLAKLDSNDAIRAAEKARASSSVLIPMHSPCLQSDTDQCSSDTVSGRSSVDIGFHRDNRTGFARFSPFNFNCREDHATSRQIPSDFRNPARITHFNPVYQASVNQSPLSTTTTTNDGDDYHSLADDDRKKTVNMLKKDIAGISGSSSTTAYWNQEAGCFVIPGNTAGSSSQISGPELTHTGHSAFIGGSLLGYHRDTPGRSLEIFRPTSPLAQQGRRDRRRSHQLPVFAPSEAKKDSHRKA